MKKLIAGAFGMIGCYSILPTLFIRNFSRQVIKHTDEPGILLTFDDGPNPHYTPKLLALLKQHQLKAIFFVVAEKAARYPELIKQMKQDGHVIGIHHYTHRSSAVLTPQQLKYQLINSQRVIKALTNQQLTFYRPPWGHFNLASLYIARDFHIMTWSAIFGDWKITTCRTTLLKNLHAQRKDGAIYVLHDCDTTLGADDEAPRFMLQVLAQFLDEATQDGQLFVDAQKWAQSYV